MREGKRIWIAACIIFLLTLSVAVCSNKVATSKQEKQETVAMAVQQNQPMTATINSNKELSRGDVAPVRTEDSLKFVGNFRLTAYDLSVESCGKMKSSSDYGITSSGLNIKQRDLSDRLIAVDTRIIKMNSKIYMSFPKDKRYVQWHGTTYDLNGWYTAVDTGGLIKGRRIDLFVGGTGVSSAKFCKNIGVVYVEVYR